MPEGYIVKYAAETYWLIKPGYKKNDTFYRPIIINEIGAIIYNMMSSNNYTNSETAEKISNTYKISTEEAMKCIGDFITMLNTFES